MLHAALRHMYGGVEVWPRIFLPEATAELSGRPHGPAAIDSVLASTGRAATDKRKTIWLCRESQPTSSVFQPVT